MHPFHISQTKSIKNNKFTLKKPFIANRKTCFHFFPSVIPETANAIKHSRYPSSAQAKLTFLFENNNLWWEGDSNLLPTEEKPLSTHPGKKSPGKTTRVKCRFRTGGAQTRGVNHYFLCNNLSSALFGFDRTKFTSFSSFEKRTRRGLTQFWQFEILHGCFSTRKSTGRKDELDVNFHTWTLEFEQSRLTRASRIEFDASFVIF